ncbi:hypothetical protein J6590_054400 [Homalodisca vitripennis]|nr:hypothetical protein J6590_054400 [Homalodisca vitripennis]
MTVVLRSYLQRQPNETKNRSAHPTQPGSGKNLKCSYPDYLLDCHSRYSRIAIVVAATATATVDGRTILSLLSESTERPAVPHSPSPPVPDRRISSLSYSPRASSQLSSILGVAGSSSEQA